MSTQKLYYDVPGMRAKFSLEIDAALCTGSGPARLAQPFTTYFADDVGEHCDIVARIAHTGAMGSAAHACLGQSPGKAVHVVLPERENTPGNISNFGVGSGQPDGGRHFTAWAFFLNPSTVVGACGTRAHRRRACGSPPTTTLRESGTPCSRRLASRI